MSNNNNINSSAPVTKGDFQQLILLINTRFDSLEKRMDSLEKRMDSLEKRMDSLEKKVDSLEERITSLEKRMDSLEKKVDSLEIKVNLLEIKVNSLEKRIDSLEGKVYSLEVNVESLRNDMDHLCQRVDSLEESNIALHIQMESLEKEVHSNGAVGQEGLRHLVSLTNNYESLEEKIELYKADLIEYVDMRIDEFSKVCIDINTNSFSFDETKNPYASYAKIVHGNRSMLLKHDTDISKLKKRVYTQ